MGIRNWINDPARAAMAGPTHREIWDRENERFDREASFIKEQNAESRNHAFRMSDTEYQHTRGINDQHFEHAKSLMGHAEELGGNYSFHPSGLPSQITPASFVKTQAKAQAQAKGVEQPKQDSAPGPLQAAASAPKPQPESRNQAAVQGESDVRRTMSNVANVASGAVSRVRKAVNLGALG